jgi:hypothetical protein
MHVVAVVSRVSVDAEAARLYALSPIAAASAFLVYVPKVHVTGVDGYGA